MDIASFFQADMGIAAISGYLSFVNSEQSSYLTAVIILFSSIVLAKVIAALYERTLLRLAEKTSSDFDDKLAHALKRPLYYAIIAVGTLLSWMSLGIDGTAGIYFADLIKTVLALIIAVGSYRAVNIFIEETIFHVSKKTEKKLDTEILPLIKNVVKLVFLLIAAFVILNIWNLQGVITPLLASAGIAGLAIAFAAQDTISHFFGGVSVYADRPFKVGDRIILESGETVIVKEIGLRSTKLSTFNNSTIVIPNSTIANSKIENMTMPVRSKIKINVGVSYDSDIDKVKKVLLDIAKKTEKVLESPAPSAYFTQMGDFSLNFLLICYVPEIGDVFATEDKINVAIIKRFRKEKIDIPFPVQTLYTPDLKKK